MSDVFRSLTAERLRELVSYDPDTGVFTRKCDRGRHKAGAVLGFHSHRGYVKIGLGTGKYYAHRLAWLYVHGEMPKVVDHINGDTTDNRICNLRNTDQGGNVQNLKRMNRTNTSGYTGVSRKRNKWAAALSLNNRHISLGSYATKEDAHAAYVEAKRKLHPMSTI